MNKRILLMCISKKAQATHESGLKRKVKGTAADPFSSWRQQEMEKNLPNFLVPVFWLVYVQDWKAQIWKWTVKKKLNKETIIKWLEKHPPLFIALSFSGSLFHFYLLSLCSWKCLYKSSCTNMMFVHYLGIVIIPK